MAFFDNFETLLPPYLNSTEKGRLKDGLAQFRPDHRGKAIDYTDFYKNYSNDIFRQADLIREIRFPFWNDEIGQYEKKYTDAIIISNTCDISQENTHLFNNKECLLAPLMDLSFFKENLIASGLNKDSIDNYIDTIRRQEKSQVFFLPATYDGVERIALLDQMFWFPVAELNSYLQDPEANKISSLSHFGYYLFLFKVSYHLCRLPESCDRGLN